MYIDLSLSLYIYLYTYTSLSLYIDIDICMYRERESERQREREKERYTHDVFVVTRISIQRRSPVSESPPPDGAPRKSNMFRCYDHFLLFMCMRVSLLWFNLFSAYLLSLLVSP